MTKVITARPRPITAHDWLAEAYPHRNRLRADVAERVAHRTPITVNPPDKTFFGLAFEHALGLDLAAEPPYPRLLDCLDEPRAHRLLGLAGYRPPDGDPTADYPLWRKTASPTCPARVFTAASSLAHLHQVLRILKPTTTDTARTALRVLLNHLPVISQYQRDTWQARPAFRAYWASYNSGFRNAVRSYGEVTVAPALLDGHRHADLIAGGTVIEVKTGRLDPPDYVNQLIDQLLTYALLATRDRHPVTHVAAYLARYEVLIRYPIQQLLDELAGAPVDAATAGGRLAAVIRASEPSQRPGDARAH